MTANTAFTTMIPTTALAILAIDLGNYKSVTCIQDGDPVSARFTRLDTDRDRSRELFAR